MSSDVISNAQTSQIYIETSANATVVFFFYFLNIYSFFLELTQHAHNSSVPARRCKEEKKSALRARDGKIDST